MATIPNRHSGFYVGLTLAAATAVTLTLSSPAHAMVPAAPDASVSSDNVKATDHTCGILSWETAVLVWQDGAEAAWNGLLKQGWKGDKRDGSETIYDPACAYDDISAILAGK